MFDRFSRQFRTVLRFVFPTRAEKEYAALLRATSQFDRKFYLESNPRLRRLFRLSPERHYVQFGEALGLSPSPYFSPRAYLFHNPDLAKADVSPLRHYIENGRREGRTTLLPAGAPESPIPRFPEIRVDDRPSPPAPVAVVVHLYYADLWPELAAALAAQSFAFDLFVTVTAGRSDIVCLTQDIQARFPKACIWEMPNHGRDIWPFVYLVNSGLLTPYRAVCKLHTKKSPHRSDGDAWRQTLIGGILGVDGTARLTRFLKDPQAGFWVADGHRHHGDTWWGTNRPRATELLARIGITANAAPLVFPAGSIYWVKPGILGLIRQMRLTVGDFEPEQALVDGTTAHALERAFGYLASPVGLVIKESSEFA